MNEHPAATHAHAISHRHVVVDTSAVGWERRAALFDRAYAGKRVRIAQAIDAPGARGAVQDDDDDDDDDDVRVAIGGARRPRRRHGVR